MKNKQQEIETLAKLITSTADCPYLNEALKIVEAQFKQDISSDFITIVSIRDSIAERVQAQVDLGHVARELRDAEAELVQLQSQVRDLRAQRDEARAECHQVGKRLLYV